jgi:uncharacterized membrane protein YdjX (TVP38/TMEM64 family)
MKKNIWISIILLGFLGLALYVLIYHSHVYTAFFDRKKLTDFVNSFGALGPVIFIALQVFQVLFAPIPGEVTGFLGGFLYGNFFGLLYSTIGLGVGSWLAFIIARWAGQPLVEWIVSPKILLRFDYLMARKGTWIAFLFFLVPGFPKDYLCYILGLSHMDLKTFLIISTVGRVLGTAILTFQGYLVREGNYLALGVVVALSILFILLAYLYREKLESYFRRQRQHFVEGGLHPKVHKKQE